MLSMLSFAEVDQIFSIKSQRNLCRGAARGERCSDRMNPVSNDTSPCGGDLPYDSRDSRYYPGNILGPEPNAVVWFVGVTPRPYGGVGVDEA